jgi:hypothetical protein
MLYGEHTEQVRRHEGMRERSTTAIVALATALVTVVAAYIALKTTDMRPGPALILAPATPIVDAGWVNRVAVAAIMKTDARMLLPY